MSTIQIVNWLLTRRCNLRCSYCRIVKEYDKPSEYPDLKHYYENEISVQDVIDTLAKLKRHNENLFHIFYGGEPCIKSGLDQILDFCNNENIYYTIITNGTDRACEALDRIFDKIGYIQGLTTSIDPIITKDLSDDRTKKTYNGLEKLLKYKGRIADLVAEITVDNSNLENLIPLVKHLSFNGINSDITFIDIAKSNYYDFSNITDESVLVDKKRAKGLLEKLSENDDLDIHMKDELLPLIYESLPSNLDCGIDKDVHNLTIDADGSIRLCLRIRGVGTPSKFNISNFMNEDGVLNDGLIEEFKADKSNYCKGCNWTCMLHSKLSSEDEENVKSMLHSDRR